MIISTLRKRLSKEVEQGASVLSIAKAIKVSQPQLRAFCIGESNGSALLLEKLAKRYQLKLK